VKSDSLSSVNRPIQSKPRSDCSIAIKVQTRMKSQKGHAAGDLEEKGEPRRHKDVDSTRLQGGTATTQQVTSNK
jgi:hypothetical protein